MAASPSPAVGLWGGARSGEKTGGGASSVGRSGHPAAGKLGDKEGSGEGKAKFGVASAAVVSESAPARTDAAPARPRDAFPFAVPGRAETAALAVVAGPGAAPRGAQCGGARRAFREKAAGCKGPWRPRLGPPMPGLPDCSALRLSSSDSQSCASWVPSSLSLRTPNEQRPTVPFSPKPHLVHNHHLPPNMQCPREPSHQPP